MATRVLTSSSAIRRGIGRILDPKAKHRGMAVAFLGAAGPQYLPEDLIGTSVACWLRPGATDPYAIRELKRRGATLFSVDGLHAKAYWSDVGALIGSANLSGHALANDGLREAVVELAPAVFDGPAFLLSLKGRPISAARLIEFEKQHRLYLSRNDGVGFTDAAPAGAGKRLKPGSRTRRRVSFGNWRASFGRTPWRLLVYDEVYSKVGAATRRGLLERRRSSAHDFVSVTRGWYPTRSWILSVDMKPARYGFDWFYPEMATTLTRRDQGWAPGASVELVQLSPCRAHGRPPFELDAATKKAIRLALVDIGVRRQADLLRGMVDPSRDLLAAIQKHL